MKKNPSDVTAEDRWDEAWEGGHPEFPVRAYTKADGLGCGSRRGLNTAFRAWVMGLVTLPLPEIKR